MSHPLLLLLSMCVCNPDINVISDVTCVIYSPCNVSVNFGIPYHSKVRVYWGKRCCILVYLSRRGSRDIFGGGELGSFRLPTLYSLPTFLETGKIAFLFALQVN